MSKKLAQISTPSTEPSLLELISHGGPVDSQNVDYRAISFRLYKALRRLLAHESVGRWTQAPFPKSNRLGCQFCEQEWANHAKGCLFVRLEKFVSELDIIFKS
jgi:hypothetical protein